VRTFEIAPEDVGLGRSKADDLRGGDAKVNAAALLEVVKGTKSPHRDVAVINAGAALVVAGKAANVKEGVTLAQQSVDSGEAKKRLDRLAAISNA
jgi:anthranilate phosphoribosyltransferase